MNRKIKLRLPVSILIFLLIIEVEKGLLLTNLYVVQNHLGLSSGFLQQISFKSASLNSSSVFEVPFLKVEERG